MRPPLEAALAAVMVETLEKLAFLFATPADEAGMEDRDGGGPMQAVRVAFTGPFRGEVELGLSPPVLDELTANMLGSEEGDPPSTEERHDALKELANVVCGNLLPVIGGSEAEFSIAAPRIADTTGGGEAEGLAVLAARCRLRLENGGCRADLRLERPHPSSAGGHGAAQNLPRKRVAP